MTFDREQTLTLARNALHDASCGERCEPTAMGLQIRQAERVLLVIVRAVTDEIRELHAPRTIEMPSMDNLTWCSHCPGGTNYPCRTVRLCEEIEAACEAQR